MFNSSALFTRINKITPPEITPDKKNMKLLRGMSVSASCLMRSIRRVARMYLIAKCSESVRTHHFSNYKCICSTFMSKPLAG